MAWASAASAAAAAGGSIFGSAFGTTHSAKAARREAKKAREWQMYVAKNKHQWEVEGLKKAGLNPILAAGVSPSSGNAPPPAPVPDFGRIGESVGKGVSSAIDLLKAKEEVKNLGHIGIQIQNDAALKNNQAFSARNAALREGSQHRLIETQNSILKLQFPGAKTESAIDSSAYGSFLRYIDRLNPLTGSPISRPTKGK